MNIKLNKIHSRLLSIRLAFYCVYYPVKAIILSYLKKNSRENNTKLIKSFSQSILRPLKIKFIFNNWDILNNLPTNKPIILMSNHSSLYDIPILLNTMPDTIDLRMLAKKELARIPIFGTAMKKLGFPIINRKNHNQALQDLEKTKKLMQDGIVIWAAPEGTRSQDSSLLPFKKGIFIMAIEIDALIVPISISGANKVLPAKSHNFSMGETVKLSVGTPLDTSKYTQQDRDYIIANIRQEIAKNL